MRSVICVAGQLLIKSDQTTATVCDPFDPDYLCFGVELLKKYLMMSWINVYLVWNIEWTSYSYYFIFTQPATFLLKVLVSSTYHTLPSLCYEQIICDGN